MNFSSQLTFIFPSPRIMLAHSSYWINICAVTTFNSIPNLTGKDKLKYQGDAIFTEQIGKNKQTNNNENTHTDCVSVLE